MCSDRIVVNTWNCCRHLELYGCVEIKLLSTLGIIWMCSDKIIVDTVTMLVKLFLI